MFIIEYYPTQKYIIYHIQIFFTEGFEILKLLIALRDLRV